MSLLRICLPSYSYLLLLVIMIFIQSVLRYYYLNIMYVMVDFNHSSGFHNYDLILKLLN